MMHSRRDFARLVLGGAAVAGLAPTAASAAAARAAPANRAPAAPVRLPTQFGGVDVGYCLYNFRAMERPADQSAYIDAMIKASLDTGVGLVEINSNYVEPTNFLPFQGIPRVQDAFTPPAPGATVPRWLQVTKPELQAERDRMRAWRIDRARIPYFREIGERMRRAGLTPYSYVITFTPDMNPLEIDAIFQHAEALGVKIFSTNQTKVEMAPRLVPFADRYGMDIGFHNHAAKFNPNEVASLQSFERMFELSPRMKANLDVGHYRAADLDAVEFVKKHYARITHLHLKDRRGNNGPNMPWGQGETPLRELLQLVKQNRWPIACIVEYEYQGTGTGVEETKKCLEFMRQVLA